MLLLSRPATVIVEQSQILKLFAYLPFLSFCKYSIMSIRICQDYLYNFIKETYTNNIWDYCIICTKHLFGCPGNFPINIIEYFTKEMPHIYLCEAVLFIEQVGEWSHYTLAFRFLLRVWAV